MRGALIGPNADIRWQARPFGRVDNDPQRTGAYNILVPIVLNSHPLHSSRMLCFENGRGRVLKRDRCSGANSSPLFAVR
jgi:hypothetical protein